MAIFTSTISLSGPRGVAVNKDLDQILICDTDNNRVVRATIQGVKTVSTLNFAYAGSVEIPYNMDAPFDAIYHDGYYYVSLQNNHLVVRFRARDMAEKGYFGTANSRGSTTALLDSPKQLATDGQFLYIADSGNGRIVKLTLSTLAYSTATSSIGGTALTGVSGLVYKKEGGEALFVYANGNFIKCETDFTSIDSATLTTPNGIGIGFFNDYVYVPDATTLNIYASNGLTLTDTQAVSVNSLVGHEGVLIATSSSATGFPYTFPFTFTAASGTVNVLRAYNPRDSFTQATPMKVGGAFFDNPFVILGEDSLVVGATQEGTLNYWKEENKDYSRYAYVEEDNVSSTWTEESAVSSSWTEES